MDYFFYVLELLIFKIDYNNNSGSSSSMVLKVVVLLLVKFNLFII